MHIKNIQVSESASHMPLSIIRWYPSPVNHVRRRHKKILSWRLSVSDQDTLAMETKPSTVCNCKLVFTAASVLRTCESGTIFLLCNCKTTFCIRQCGACSLSGVVSAFDKSLYTLPIPPLPVLLEKLLLNFDHFSNHSVCSEWREQYLCATQRTTRPLRLVG